jgi:hypothetical protein
MMNDDLDESLKEIKPKEFFRRGDAIMAANSTVHWVVKHFIERNTVNMVYGDPKSGKSFIVYDMALHVAHGRTWRGRKVIKGAVFVLCGEGQGGISRRLKAWDSKNKYELDAPFFVSEHAVLIGSGKAAEKAADEIERMAEIYGVEPVMVVIDTLARNFDGDENSSEDASRFITEVDLHLKSRRNCAVVVVHHSGNQEKGRGRGSSAFVGALDACFKVESDKTATGLSSKFSTDYLKDGASPETLHFDCQEIEVGADDDGEPITSLCPVPVNPPSEQKEDGKYLKILRGVLSAMGEDNPLNYLTDDEEEARKRFYQHPENAIEKTDTRRKRFVRAWAEIIKETREKIT